MITARGIGILLIIVGVVTAASWFIEPLRNAWPALWAWFISIPFVIRVGLTIAVIGFSVVFASLIAERVRDRRSEGDLTDD